MIHLDFTSLNKYKKTRADFYFSLQNAFQDFDGCVLTAFEGLTEVNK